METSIKQLYETPSTRVVEVTTEGIVCESGGIENYNRNSQEDW